MLRQSEGAFMWNKPKLEAFFLPTHFTVSGNIMVIQACPPMSSYVMSTVNNCSLFII